MGFLNAGFISVISKGKETWALRNSKTGVLAYVRHLSIDRLGALSGFR